MFQEIQISNFTAGELSPRMKGRTDFAKYYSGLDTMVNMVAMPQGGAAKRPGTRFSALAKDQSPTPFAVRNLSFIFSTVQPYQLEIGGGYIRVYMNDAPVLSGGVPVEIAVPYTTADLPAIKTVQSADTLFMCCGSGGSNGNGYPLATLTRSSHTNWTYSALALKDGPYLSLNNDSANLCTPSATSGTITLSFAGAVNINNGAGFSASDIGRMIRFLSSDGTTSAWVSLVIASIISITSVTATVQPNTVTTQAALQGVVAGASWMLGAFGPNLGFPYVPYLWQQRLVLLGNNLLPNAMWASNTGAFDTFGPTNIDNTVTPSNGLFWVIDDDQVNAIQWASTAGSAQTMQLGIGTTASEEIMQPATTTAALSSTNVQVYRETVYGSAANVPVLRIGKAILFADRTARKIREWAYYWQAYGYIGLDKTQESEHITRGTLGDPDSWGVRTMCYQQSPHQVIWAVRNDGCLLSFTYDNPQAIWAGARHQIGGHYYGGPPIVESCCTIPAPDGTYDELWLVVLRTINGVPTRFVEVMTRFFDGLPADSAWFVDCALNSQLGTPNATLTPPQNLPQPPPAAGTQAQTLPLGFTGTGTFTTDAAAFAGNGTDIGKIIRVNAGQAIVTAPISTTAVTAMVTQPLLSRAPAAAETWSCTAPFSTFTGLDYADGETMAALADGAPVAPRIVSGGAIALPNAASKAIAGFAYTPVLVTMPFEAQRAGIAMSRGRAKRVEHLYLRLFETGGCWFGRRMTEPTTGVLEDLLEPLEMRQPSLPLNQAPSLFSGIRRLDSRGGWDREGQVIVTQDRPLPLTVLALNASVEVGDQPVVQQA